jgi:hypothetical protein
LALLALNVFEVQQVKGLADSKVFKRYKHFIPPLFYVVCSFDFLCFNKSGRALPALNVFEVFQVKGLADSKVFKRYKHFIPPLFSVVCLLID